VARPRSATARREPRPNPTRATFINMDTYEINPSKEWPPEHWSLNQKWATAAIFRANGGLNFLIECLEYIHRGGTDAAYSRSLYILLSYNVELIFEARLLLVSEQLGKDERQLRAVLKCKHNHDLELLSYKIGKDDLQGIGIVDVKSETKNDLKRYVVTMSNGDKIIVEDLECVRYDFEKYNKRRDSDFKEAERIKGEVKSLLNITYIIMEMLPKQ